MVPEKFCNTQILQDAPNPSHAAPTTLLLPSPAEDFKSPAAQKPAGPATSSFLLNSLLIYLCSGCLTLVGKGMVTLPWATSLHLPLHLLALSAHLRAPGSSGAAQIPRKHQHKCLKHSAGISVAVPAPGTFSPRHPRDVMQPTDL